MRHCRHRLLPRWLPSPAVMCYAWCVTTVPYHRYHLADCCYAYCCTLPLLPFAHRAALPLRALMPLFHPPYVRLYTPLPSRRSFCRIVRSWYTFALLPMVAFMHLPLHCAHVAWTLPCRLPHTFNCRAPVRLPVLPCHYLRPFLPDLVPLPLRVRRPCRHAIGGHWTRCSVAFWILDLRYAVATLR